MILTCTCRLTGFVRLIPANKNELAERTARRLFGKWLSIFGIPESMIGDCDKLWTSRFWRELFKPLGMKINLTTAYHPHADGRAERTIKTMNELLRSATQGKQGKWLESLPMVEYAINSAANACHTEKLLSYVFVKEQYKAHIVMCILKAYYFITPL